jgi:protein disulfide-isomerase
MHFAIALEGFMAQTSTMNIPRSFLLLLVAALLISPAFANGWGDDYKAALATAAKENKKVLLDFTGSDWCGWCIKLKKETFDQPAFKDYADKNLVLVEVDFPKGKSQTPAVKAQNNSLQQQYQVQGFPTLVVLDPQGKLIKQQSGYVPGGPAGFISWLNSK